MSSDYYGAVAGEIAGEGRVPVDHPDRCQTCGRHPSDGSEPCIGCPDYRIVHYTPEEEDQPECDADVDADPETVMYGTLNPLRVTCPDCLRIMA